MLQLTREQPPGYGGVERVAHELADAIAAQGPSSPSRVYYLFGSSAPDPLPVHYRRIRLPAWSLGRLPLPLPSPALARLLLSPDSLIAHLPCPTVLGLALLCKLLRPRRRVCLVWHSFLEIKPAAVGVLTGLYQRAALALLRLFDQVITTSPVLQAELARRSGLPLSSFAVLPCCVPASFEQQALAAPSPPPDPAALRLITISRLTSYNRIDWLLEAIAQANATDYGLAAYLFTHQAARIHRLVERLEFGTIGINEVRIIHPGIPFGGVKESGIGRENGTEGIHEYLEVRSAVLHVPVAAPPNGA